MDDKVYEQVLEIRADSKYNMFDTAAVQREAYEKGYNELVIYLEEHKKDYVQFILNGKR